MEFRLGVMRDLPLLKAVYRDIVQEMNRNQIQIWDTVYPCEFFCHDIKENRLYVLTERGELISAFALCGTNSGERSVQWRNRRGKALYLERLGVSTSRCGMGIGSLMLEKAKKTAKAAGAEYLRLFVAEENAPAIGLYRRNGFVRADGVYDEAIDDTLVLHEYGYEAAL